jgi:hypothetical protein
VTRIAVLGAGRLSAAAAIASILAQHPEVAAVDVSALEMRAAPLEGGAKIKPVRGKVNTRHDYPGMTDEQRAWNQAVDKRKAEKAARRAALPAPQAAQKGRP